MDNLVLKLLKEKNLNNDEMKYLLESDLYDDKLYAEADRIRQEVYGKSVYIRGLIEFSNFCKMAV